MLFHTEGIIIPVNRRDPYSGEALEGLFLGGPFPTDRGAMWEDFNLKIVQYSMQRENQAMMQSRVIGFYQLFERIMERAAMMPWVRWMSVLRDCADAFNMAGKAEEWVIPEMFGAFSQPEQAPVSSLLGSQGPPQRHSLSPPMRSMAGQPNRLGGQDQEPGLNFGNSTNSARANGQTGGPRLENVLEMVR